MAMKASYNLKSLPIQSIDQNLMESNIKKDELLQEDKQENIVEMMEALKRVKGCLHNITNRLYNCGILTNETKKKITQQAQYGKKA